MSRPSNDRRHPDAAFVKVGFAAAESPSAAVEVDLPPMSPVGRDRPVIARKEQERLVSQTEAVEVAQQSTDLVIHISNVGLRGFVWVSPDGKQCNSLCGKGIPTSSGAEKWSIFRIG